ncbi:MAG: F0F1 ATP synthase subunit B [Thermoflavifilum sp.]|nr:F0F1 ATP synthase subunit B [Thermoflavifilum sp.]MCL6513189.1 F0F1 ATP synthase subunit B [Alicyclobacillus sp.]
MVRLFELGTFVVSIITFLILFWLIKHFGFEPLAKMLEQRRVHIETQISEAEKSRAEAEALLAEQRRLLEEARQEAKRLLESAQARADEQARQIVAEAQAEAQRILEEGRQVIERERAEALSAVLDRVSQLTVELAAQLLREHVTPQVHEEMLQEAEKRLGELVC